ncbi:MAG: DUF4012 domain-containing protein [Acidimicrobiales bacterium]
MAVLVAGVVLVVVAAAFTWRPTWAAQLPRETVWAAAVLGAVVLGLSNAAPTGWSGLDLILRAGAGALVVLAADSRGWPITLWALGLAAFGLVVGGSSSGWAMLAAGGVAVGAGTLLSGGQSAELRAVAIAASLGAFAHLDWPLVTGASSMLSVAALVPLLLAGLGSAPPRARVTATWAFVLFVLVGFAGAVVGAIAAAGAASDVERAVDAAVAGLDQADADDPAPAIAELREAADAFAEAESGLRAVWARPALLVPGVAQHARAVATMADAGEDLATAAADSLEEVDLDSLHPAAGRIDPALLAEVEPPLDRALTSLRRADSRLADVRSPLLVPLVADRLEELADKVADARQTAETASSALDVAPGLLGVDEPRRYFLVMHTPSELRGVGGFMGSWGELVTDGGRLDLVRTGRLRQLTEGGEDPEARQIEGHPEFVAHWGQGPARFWGIIGFSPDFPTVASIISQLYPQSGGDAVDGVIALDPAGFAALLELTGPITVEGFDGELAPENAEQILLHDQYLGGPDDDREAFLEAAVRALFDELTAGDLPGPRSISAALAPMVDGRHIQLFSNHEAEQSFFSAIGATGSVRRRTPDAVGVVGQNYGGNKIDYFLRRSLSYDVTWDPATGEVDGTLTVRLENQAPAAGLPRAVIGWGGDVGYNELPTADGENLSYVSLYTALSLEDVTVDGAPVELNRVVDDLGHRSYDAYVRIPAQTTRTLRAQVSGQIEPGDAYRLQVLRQPTAVADRYELTIRLPAGWLVHHDDSETQTVVVEADARRPVDLQITAEREHPTLLDRLRGR